tara:strand:+ start:1754 stop:2488 length:735 start_codon:yes stop_codon:yes gene_type:complete
MTDLVTSNVTDHYIKITFDDGKVNIMSPRMLGALHDAFDQALAYERPIILTGRPGIFSAGFDIKVIRGDSAVEQHNMLRLGAELALKVLTYPFPVVTACTGHALPMGAFLMLASDVRIGVEGDFRIGMNEVAIGLTVPYFAIELARSRLTPAYFNRSITTGEQFKPSEAVLAGYLDMVVSPEAMDEKSEAIATVLALGTHMPSHAASKLRARQPTIDAMRKAIDSELTLENARAARKRAAKEAA